MAQANVAEGSWEKPPWRTQAHEGSPAEEGSDSLWATLRRAQGLREANTNSGEIHEVWKLYILDIPVRVTE